MQEFPRALKPITVWLVVGTALFLAVQAWQSHRKESRFQMADGVIELRRQPDGHFHWPGQLNGRAVDFLVDTGATRTAVPRSLVPDTPSEGIVRSSTAGGEVQGDVIRVDLTLQGGLSVQRMRVVALPELQLPLLGMDVLGRVRFAQQDGVLRIEPAAR
jgi:aspartyl protease family protein